MTDKAEKIIHIFSVTQTMTKKLKGQELLSVVSCARLTLFVMQWHCRFAAAGDQISRGLFGIGSCTAERCHFAPMHH